MGISLFGYGSAVKRGREPVAQSDAAAAVEEAERLTPEEAIAKGYALVGTVDTVTRALEANMKRQPVDWVFCYTYNSLVPHPILMKSIETFWTKVMPRFR